MIIGAWSQACLDNVLVIACNQLSCNSQHPVKNNPGKWECNIVSIGAWSQAYLDLISWCDTSVDIDKSLNIYFTSRMRGKPYSGPEVLDIE